MDRTVVGTRLDEGADDPKPVDPTSTPTTRYSRLSRVAWWTGVLGSTVTAVGIGFLVRFDLLGPTVGIYLSSVLVGLAGAAVAARHPRNPVGWLLIVSTCVTATFLLIFDYSFAATRGGLHDLPFAVWAAWLASWLWVVPFGASMAPVLIRMPDGAVRPGWRFVDRLAILGTLSLVVGIALAAGPTYPLGLATNPLGVARAAGFLAVLRDAGIVCIGIAMLAGVASIGYRLRSAAGDEFQQLKWIAFGGGLVAASVVFGGLLFVLFNVEITAALTPFALAVLIMPVVVGVAMLRYRLYDIDLIINRTLVYGGLTAILAGLYSAGVTFGQRFFIAATGQKSDAAVVFTAFAVASLFTPVRDGLQKTVSRYVSPSNPRTLLQKLEDNVNAVVAVLDGQSIARRLLTEATSGYGARFGALYLDQQGVERLVHQVGSVDGDAGIEIAIRLDENLLGRLVLGQRRGGVAYSHSDLETLQKSADAIARALVIAYRFEVMQSPA
jgi:hypothetical protein